MRHLSPLNAPYTHPKRILNTTLTQPKYTLNAPRMHLWHILENGPKMGKYRKLFWLPLYSCNNIKEVGTSKFESDSTQHSFNQANVMVDCQFCRKNEDSTITTYKY